MDNKATLHTEGTLKPQAILSVPIEVLRFDPKNPRLPSNIDGHDESAVLKWMLEDASIIELMNSIGEQGYFPGEPLLVWEPTKGSGEYEVIEGNRRLAAARLLRQPEIAPARKLAVQQCSTAAANKPGELPVLVYGSREEILSYLGYRHITGVKPWSSLAKAKYADQLLKSVATTEQNPQEQYRVIARTIGSRADYVAKLLTGLALFDKMEQQRFYGIRNLNEESIEFSLLTTSLGYRGIVSFLCLEANDDPKLAGLSDERLQEFTKWVYEENAAKQTRVGESRNLRKLNYVVANPQALAAFRSGADLDEAVLLTAATTDVFRNALGRALLSLETARDNVHLATGIDQSDLERLTEITAITRNLRAAVEASLRGDDDE